MAKNLFNKVIKNSFIMYKMGKKNHRDVKMKLVTELILMQVH